MGRRGNPLGRGARRWFTRGVQSRRARFLTRGWRRACDGFVRNGATVAEVLIALICGLLVVQLSLAGLARVRSVGLRLTQRSEILAALRVSRVVLRRELRFGVRGVDWVDFAPDSISLRAFRGVGVVCPDGALAPDLMVAWSGMRAPAPEKDSVLLLTGNRAKCHMRRTSHT